jgi:hypothetical protein
MRHLLSILLSMTFACGSVYGDGFGFSLGPFSLLFGSFDGDYLIAHRRVLDNPICYAISHRKKLEIIVEGAEIVNSKEKKIVSKEITVEPYAFGINEEGKPFLKGKVVQEKMLKEVTVKYGDEQFDEPSITMKDKVKTGFYGLFTSSSSQAIDIRQIVQLRVLEDSSFEAPKDYKSNKDPKVQIICELPEEKK